MPQSIDTVSKKTFSKRTRAAHIFLGSVALLFLIVTFFAKQYSYFPFDLVITRTIQNISFPGFRSLMLAITFIGNDIPAVFWVISTGLFLYVRGHKRAAIMTILSPLGTEYISFLFKTLVARQRPDPTLINQLLSYNRADSFPSGHVLFYVGFFGFLLFLTYSLFPKGLYRKILLIVLSVLVFLIGPSRIYVGAHWFSDVLGAYLIGFLWLSFMMYVYKNWHVKSEA
jgi:membrane-associated phospholipid phosphatase